MFNWREVVPVFVVLQYMKYKAPGSVITNWAPTPKGGKLHSVDGNGVAHVRQYFLK